MDRVTENARESPKHMLKAVGLQSEKLAVEGLSRDDTQSQEISFVEGIEELEVSPDGMFDGSKIPSIFEVNEREDVAFKNAIARSEKRFEMALGLNLLKKEYFELKPVRLSFIFYAKHVGGW